MFSKRYENVKTNYDEMFGSNESIKQKILANKMKLLILIILWIISLSVLVKLKLKILKRKDVDEYKIKKVKLITYSFISTGILYGLVYLLGYKFKVIHEILTR